MLNFFTYTAYGVLGVVRCRSWAVCVLVACCSATHHQHTHCSRPTPNYTKDTICCICKKIITSIAPEDGRVSPNRIFKSFWISLRPGDFKYHLECRMWRVSTHVERNSLNIERTEIEFSNKSFREIWNEHFYPLRILTKGVGGMILTGDSWKTSDKNLLQVRCFRHKFDADCSENVTLWPTG